MDAKKGELFEKLMLEFTTYMKRMETMDAKDILRKADEISAAKDVFHFIMQPGNLGGGEIEYLLTVGEPLRLIRDQWLYNEKDISEGMSNAIVEVCGRDIGEPGDCGDEDEDENEL